LKHEVLERKGRLGSIPSSEVVLKSQYYDRLALLEGGREVQAKFYKRK